MIESNYLRMIMEEDEGGFNVSTSWMEKKFRIFNEKYFGGKLPLPKFEINRKSVRHGECLTKMNIYTGALRFTIRLSKYFNKMNEWEYENVLIHEMIHECNHFEKGFNYIVKEGKSADVKGHGPSFITEMERINAIGDHKVLITGISDDAGKMQNSSDKRDYTQDAEKYRFIILTQKGKIMGFCATLKTLSFVIGRLQKWNLFVCKINDPILYKKYPRFFRRNQGVKAGPMEGDDAADKVLNSKRLSIEEVYIKDNCKLMYKPSVFSIEYLEDPQTYIENGEKMNNNDEKSIKEKVSESINRKRRKAIDSIDSEDLKKVYDDVEIVGDELIVSIE